MRESPSEELEASRISGGDFLSSPRGSMWGAFQKGKLTIISSGRQEWEHVSVSRASRGPTWEEMCVVKDLFWGADETVIQYHPPRSDYVNLHPHCLHMWKPHSLSNYHRRFLFKERQ